MMFWSPKKRFERLVARYLNPSRLWSAKDDAAIREQMRTDERARELYNKRVIAHRLMLGLDTDSPSHIEKQRMMTATVGLAMAAEASQQASAWHMPAWLVPASAMAAAALVAVVLISGPSMDRTGGVAPSALPDRSEYLSARGDAREDARAGIGVSGVTANQREYEVQHDRAWLQDRLRFFYRCSDESISHLFLFGLQRDESPRWYFPLPAEDELESISISCSADAGRVQLDGDTRLASRHQEGPLTLVGIFSDAPLPVAAIEEALEGRIEEILEGTFEDNLRAALDLEEADVVSVVHVWVQPGTSEDGDAPR